MPLRSTEPTEDTGLVGLVLSKTYGAPCLIDVPIVNTSLLSESIAATPSLFVLTLLPLIVYSVFGVKPLTEKF